MTTLELATRIATAVIRATQPAGMAPYGDAPAQAVLDTLRACDSWFCRVVEDEINPTVETVYEQMSFNWSKRAK